jgi:curved DNA-binding protein CbpA
LADEPKIPKIVVEASTLQSLRLSATEGFVLSRIDGRTSESELTAATSLPVSTVRAALEKLESLKVIVYASRPPPVVPPPRAPATVSAKAGASGSPPAGSASIPTPSGQSSSGPPRPGQSGGPGPSGPGTATTPEPGANKEDSTVAARVRAAMAAVPADSPELAEEVDLAPELRLRILGTSAVLESLDYYEVLGVSRAADKKGVKRAYFEIAALVHPDRYFRKHIGSYKLKMETLFGRATQALDTLSSKELRAEYDAYLVDLDRTRAIEDLMRSAAAEAQRAEEDAVRSAGRGSIPDINVEVPNPVVGAQNPVHPASVPPQSRPRISGLYSVPRTPPPAPRQSAAPSAPAVSDQARRDALALRLLGSRSLPPRGGPPSSPSGRASRAPLGPPSDARGAIDKGDALKRRYEDRIELARKAQANKYLNLAHEAEAKKDVVGAATAYRVALGFLAPDDPTIEAAKAAILAGEQVLVETYLRQAKYEDQAEHWQDAARSWQRVVRTRPQDAHAHERAAHAIARSGGDLHLAAQLGTKAVALEPENFEYKTTLAVVYIEAGLFLNARRELEAALQLSPRNAKIQALLKRVHKAG